jgi:hypothetical protein
MPEEFNIDVFCVNETVGGPGKKARIELVIDEDGSARLVATYVYSSENTTPEAVWHGRIREIGWTGSEGDAVSPDPEKMEALALKLAPLAARVAAGRTIGWDGSNMRGTLDEDAAQAEDEIELIFDALEADDWQSDDLTVWDAEEWIQLAVSEGLTAETTDEEIEAIAEADAEQAKKDGVLLQGSTFEARRERRDEMIAERDGEA